MANNNNNNGGAHSQIDSLIQMTDLQDLLLSAMQQKVIGYEQRDRLGHFGRQNYSTTRPNTFSQRSEQKGELLDILYQALSGEAGYPC